MQEHGKGERAIAWECDESKRVRKNKSVKARVREYESKEKLLLYATRIRAL